MGKAHTTFQNAIRKEDRDKAGERGASRELAKAQEGAWKRPPYPERPGFRHELASTLALFEFLRRTRSDHPALLGADPSLLTALGVSPVSLSEGERMDVRSPPPSPTQAL